MPEIENPKIRPAIEIPKQPLVRGPYAELQMVSNFSFLRGGSHPEELMTRAAELGCHAAALTDINSLAGIVRAKVAAEQIGIPFLVGCRLQVKAALGVLGPGADAPYLSLLVYPTDRAAYGGLCRLLTYGKRRAAKGHCDLTLQDVIDHQAGLLAVAFAAAVVEAEEFAANVPTACARFLMMTGCRWRQRFITKLPGRGTIEGSWSNKRQR